MDKITEAAETERRGALLKKFRQVERRSGGLCNPALLEKVVRSSSVDGKAGGAKTPSPLESPRRSTFSSWGGSAQAAAAGKARAAGAGGGSGAGFPVEAGFDSGGVGNAEEDIPWADDMLCGTSRKRHAAMLKSRGRALARALARMLRGVSSDLQGVASRLPPWEEDEMEGGEAAVEGVRAAWRQLFRVFSACD